MKKIILLATFLISAYNETKAQSLNFDGSDDYVSAGNILTPSYTKEAWIYMTANTGSNNIISGGDADGEHAFWAPGQILSAGHNGNWGTVQDNTTLNFNQWYHVAVSYDAVSQVMTLYKNGIQVSQATSVGYTNGAMVRIGAYNDAGNLFEGSIDEVHIWSTVRTAAQIQSDMSCSFATAQTGLIASYNFNQGTPNGNNTGITTLTDGSGNNNNGTLYNFALTGTTSNWIGDVNMTAVYPDVTFSGTTNICSGANTILSAASTLATSYTWSANAGSATTSTVSLTPGATDTYTLNAANGVCIASDTISVLVNSTPTVSISGGNIHICSGTTVTLTATGAATYTWSANAGGVTTAVISGAPTSTKTYTVTGANGNCTVTAVTTVSVTLTPNITITNSVGSLCAGNTATLTAHGSTTYTWSANAGSSTSNVVTLSPGTTDTYSVMGNNGICADTATITINVNSLPSVSVNSTTICAGTTATLTASGTATTYSWSTSETTASIISGPTTTTDYTVWGEDGNGCMNNATATISVNAMPIISVTNPTVCIGSTAVLTTSGTATSFTWSTSQTGSSITITPTLTTDYTVTGTDGNGCTNMATTTITINSLPSVSVNGMTTCAGVTTTLTASGTAVSYAWSSGENTASITPSPTVTTDYTVTGTDVNTCTNTAVATVTVNPLPSVTANGAVICAGSTATLTAGGTATAYTWSNGATGSPITVSATTTTDYTVTGTDGNNCMNTAVATLTVNALPTISVNGAAVCIGNTGTLTANGTATSYTWNTGDNTPSIAATSTITTNYTVTGTDINNCVNMAIATLTVNTLPVVSVSNQAVCLGNTATLTATGTATSYTWNTGAHTPSISPTTTVSITGFTVTGADANGCMNTATAILTVNDLPTISASSAAICAGATATLTASGTATGYTWSTGANTASITPTATTTTNYTVTGTDGNNCMNTAVATLTVNTLPIISVSSTTVCAGNMAVLTASGAISYSWNTGAVTPSVSVTAGSYTVTGIDGNNCSNTTVGTPVFNPLPVKTVTTSGAVLTATNASATYQWIDCGTHTAINNQTNQAYTATVTGNYQVMLTENGCVDTSACYPVTVTGINSFVNNQNISIYPNPATDAFYLQTNTIFDNATVEVYDIIGQKVLVEKLQNNLTRLSLNNLNNAVYQIRVISNNVLIYQSKVIKQQ
jgi:hypothetical protein